MAMTKRFDSKFFINNRQKLANKLSGGLVVLAGHHSMQKKSDVAYPFSQESNFWYLSGVDRPDCKLVYDGTSNRTWIVVPSLDKVQQIFEGDIDEQELIDMSGADEVVRADDLDRLLRQLARQHATVYTLDYSAQTDSVMPNPSIRKNKKVLERIFNSVIDCRKEIAELRAIKTSEEIAAIKSAVNLTTKAFESIYKKFDEFSYEYEIEAEFIYEFRKNNAVFAYDPIVAGGKNACTLHYGQNSERLKKNQLVLLDIGAEVDGYAADITRTYALGKPKKRIIELHQAMQTAHAEIIKQIAPNMPIMEYQQQVDKIMKNMMVDVGLIDDADDVRYREYFPHAISHGLGIDVHDSLGGSRVLAPGMIITVEPGIYILEESIGIRLEDDILITETGAQNLSAKLSTAY